MCFPGLPQSRHGRCPGEAFRALADMFLPLEGHSLHLFHPLGWGVRELAPGI